MDITTNGAIMQLQRINTFSFRLLDSPDNQFELNKSKAVSQCARVHFPALVKSTTNLEALNHLAHANRAFRSTMPSVAFGCPCPSPCEWMENVSNV